jgi:hypothetical protein
MGHSEIVRVEWDGLKGLQKKAGIWIDISESIAPGLKPAIVVQLYAGVETPASLRIEFLRPQVKFAAFTHTVFRGPLTLGCAPMLYLFK